MSITITDSITTKMQKLNHQYESYLKTDDSNKRVKILSKMGETLSFLAMMTQPSLATQLEEHELHKKVSDIWNLIFGSSPPHSYDGNKQVPLSNVEAALKKIGDLFRVKFVSFSKTLPQDTQLHCLSFLSLLDICSVSRVSKGSYLLARDESIWNIFCQDVGIKLDPSKQNDSAYKIFKESQVNLFCNFNTHLAGNVEKSDAMSSDKMSFVRREMKELQGFSSLEILNFSNTKLWRPYACRVFTLEKEPYALSHPTWDWIWENMSYTDILLSRNKLSVFPNGMRYLKIKTLSLAENNFSKFPSHLNLINLTSIDLSNNLLTEFPESLLSAHELKALDISNNSISKLPERINLLSQLTFFQADNTSLKELPETFWELTELDRLGLSDNHISELSESIGNLRKLQSLYIENNKLKTLPTNLWSLPVYIKVIDNPIERLSNLSTIPVSSQLRVSINEDLPESVKRNLIAFRGDDERKVVFEKKETKPGRSR